MLLEKPLPWKRLLVILIGNLIGAVFMGTIFALTDVSLRHDAYEIIYDKTSEHFWRVLGSSFATGILMYLAVKIYRTGSPLGIFLCVPAFLLSRFDHCIAIAAYIAMSTQSYTWFSLAFLVLSIVGNTVGSLFVSTILNYIKENKL